MVDRQHNTILFMICINKKTDIRIQFIVMQTNKTFTKPGATKTSKYFSQSNQVSNPNITTNGGLSEYLSKMNERSNQRRQYSPKPDYKYGSQIKETTYPSLKYNNVDNRHTHQKQQSDTTRTPIKIQDNDAYTDQTEHGSAYQQNTRQSHTNRTEGQIKYTRQNQPTRNHSESMDFSITAPIKLRDLQDKQRMDSYRSRVNTEQGSYQQSRRISNQKMKDRQKFDSNMSQYNKQLEYSKIVTKTLQQTIDENVQLKMDYQLLKQMHKQSLKTLVNLQQIIIDKIPQQSLSSNPNINKMQPKQFKQVYQKLFPFQSINKLIKPSLQAQLQFYKQKQNERDNKIKRQMGELESRVQSLEQKDMEIGKQNMFLREENVKLRIQLEESKLKAELQSQRQKDNSDKRNQNQQQVYKISKAYTFQAQKQEVDILPSTLSPKQTYLIQKQFESNSLSVGKNAQNHDQQYISKKDFQTVIKQLQLQKKTQFSKAEQQMRILDERCRNLQTTVDKMLEQRRKAKQIQAKNMREMPKSKKIQAQIDSHQISDNSQILGQSKISQISLKTKSGIGMIKLMKNQDEKYTNTSNSVIKVNEKNQIQKNEQKNQQKQIVKPEIKTQNKQIQIKDSKQQQQRQQQKKRLLQTQQQMAFKIHELQQNLVRSENLRSSYEEQRQHYRIRLNAVLAKLKLIRQRIEICNLDNFQYLVKQFNQIIEEKRHLILRIEELVNQKPKKVWQLQKQLNQTNKRKKQLIQRCIRLQKYVQQNVNEGRSSHNFIIEGLYDRYFEEEETQNICICPYQKAASKINEDQGKCALDWVQYLHQTMIETIKDLDAIICANLEDKILISHQTN